MSLFVRHGRLLRRGFCVFAVVLCIGAVALVENRFRFQQKFFQESWGTLLRQYSEAVFESQRRQLEDHRLQPALAAGLELSQGGCIDASGRQRLAGWAQQRTRGVRDITQRVLVGSDIATADPLAPWLQAIDGALRLTSHVLLGRTCSGGEPVILETRSDLQPQPLAGSMTTFFAGLRLSLSMQLGTHPAQSFDILFQDGRAEYRPSVAAQPIDSDRQEKVFQLAMSDEAIGLRVVYRDTSQVDSLLLRFFAINAGVLAMLSAFLLALIGIVAVLAHVVRLSERLHYLSTRDFLTGLYNRRAAMEQAGTELARAQRTGRGCCVAQIDIDHFKRVNDQFGHDAGDAVLQFFAARLQEVVRKQDLLARMGGEEFLVLLPETDLAGARCMAERLRGVLHAKAASYGQVRIPVTCSLGISEWRGQGDSLQRLLTRADQLLYQAKRQGRDRWVDDASVGARSPILQFAE